MVRNLIAITGIPGSGKTQLARLLEIHKICKRIPERVIRESYIDFDNEREVYIVDEEKFEKVIRNFLEKNKGEIWCLDSHLAHFSPKDKLLLLILVKCDENTLIERLRRRGYSDKKIIENVLSQTLETIEEEIKSNGIKFYIEVWTDKDLVRVNKNFLNFVRDIVEFLRNYKIDYS